MPGALAATTETVGATGSQVLCRVGRRREGDRAAGAWPRPLLPPRPPLCLGPQAHQPLRESLGSQCPHTLRTPSDWSPVPSSACRPGSGMLFPEARVCLCPRFCVTSLTPFGGVCVDTLHVHAVPCVTTHMSPDEGKTRTSEEVGEGGSFSLPLSCLPPPPNPSRTLEMLVRTGGLGEPVRQRPASTPRALRVQVSASEAPAPEPCEGSE